MQNLFKEVNQYCEENSGDLNKYLILNEQFTWQNFINPRMLSGKLQSKLLQFLVSLKNPSLALEIGTFSGYSAISIALGLGKHARLISIEANAEFAFKSGQYINTTPFKDKIEIINTNGLDFLMQYPHEIEFIFVDAEKNNYRKYAETIIPKLQKNGIALFDNTLWDLKVLNEHELKNDADTKNIHSFNTYLCSLNEIEVIPLPIRDGITIIQKK